VYHLGGGGLINCPCCNSPNTRVKETKNNRKEDCIVRYRTCLTCFKDFPTHERAVKYLGAGVGSMCVEGGDE